jgi:lipopolysaccharide transport system ATP-binding protein
VVFVSHNLDAVRKICHRSLLLNDGRIVSIGETEKVISEYLRILQSK